MNPMRTVRHPRPLNLFQSFPRPNGGRPISSSSIRRDVKEQKNAQLDREKMNTESNEGTKTGTDASAASQNEAAYNPDITQPQAEKEEAEKGNKHNPLDASGANPELGKPTEEEGPGAGVKRGSGQSK